MWVCQVFQAVCRRLPHDMLAAFWVLLAVATAAAHSGVNSDAGGRIRARAEIGKFFSVLSNVFPLSGVSRASGDLRSRTKNPGGHRRVADSAFAQAVDGACNRPADCSWIVDAMHGHSRQPILAKLILSALPQSYGSRGARDHRQQEW